jgi:hypothetical protein
MTNKVFQLLAALALGGAMTMTTAMAGTVTLEFTGTEGNTYSNGSVDAYAYPYFVQVVGTSTPALAMMCDDAATEISQGQSWTANTYSLTDLDLNNLKFSTDGLTTYEEAAVIFTGVVNGTIAAGDGNAAVWDLFDPGFVTASSPDDAQIVNIISTAQTEVAAGGLDYSGITVYTPTPAGASQEFLSGEVTATPEPASYALFGGGLLGLGLIRRKRNAARN